jgi:uncharacterized integral membrane protein
MWFLRSFLVLIVLAAALYLVVLNMGQAVDLYLTRPGLPTFEQVPLALALLGAFLLGIATWFLVSIGQMVGHHLAMSRLRREKEALLKELTDLRNLPLEDLDETRLALPPERGVLAEAEPPRPDRPHEATAGPRGGGAG